ncbi:MAG: hypothetical protein ACOC8B_03790 [Gemmatimonadota bacterium]
MWWVVILVLLIPLIAVISDSPLGRALASRLERPPQADRGQLEERLGMLEREVERLSGEVERLEEGTHFLQRLLEERGPRRREIGPGESSG